MTVKKILLIVMCVIMTCHAVPNASAEKYETAERIISPNAVVYTHWGDENQTSQQYNYNYVVQSLGKPNDSQSAYWQQPERVLFYRFNLNMYIEAGYSVEQAVILQKGASRQIIRLIDCPENNVENGQNYLTAPQLLPENIIDSYNLAEVNIGEDSVKELYPGARDGDNCAIDITDYVNGKTEFSYALYPHYGDRTTIYFSNHAQLYVKLIKKRSNIVFLHNNNSQQLSVSGETAESSVALNLKSADGGVCYSARKQLNGSETYYHFSVDMSAMDSGEYSAEVTFGNSETIERKFSFVQPKTTAGSVYASVDYGTSGVRIHGRAERTGDSAVMLVILKPGYNCDTLDYTKLDTESIYHMQALETNDGQYDVKVGLPKDEGSYVVIVQSPKGISKTVFTYYPDEAYELDNGIDKYTATYYAPWMLNWHMTKKNQIEAGYGGGEACQMSWALAISPENPNLMFAGTDTNGLWKSVDGGKTWRSSSAGFNSMGVADIAFDPENSEIVYALGSTGVGKYDEPNTGIYKSTDGGDTWKRVFYNKYYRVKNNGIIKFGSRNEKGVRRIFVGGHGKGEGIVYSDDEGASWNRLCGGTFAGYVTRDIALADGGNMVLLGTSGGIYLSEDGGNTFEERSPSSGAEYTVTTDPNDVSHWFCGTDSSIYETVDMGESWTLVYRFSQESGRQPEVGSVRFGYGSNPRLYAYIGPAHYPLRYSTDGGRNFTPIAKAAESTEFIEDNQGWGAETFALCESDPKLVMASLDGELYKSTDAGTTFFASSSGYSGMRASDFLFDETDDSNIFITSIDRGVVKTVNSGNDENYPLVDYAPSEDGTNIRYNGSKTMSAAARDPKDGKRIIVCVGGGEKYILKQSYDGGNTYTPINNAETVYTEHIEFNADNNRTIYAGSLISYDDGETWNRSEVTVRAVSPFDGNTVYGMRNGRPARSYDEGRTWEEYGPNVGAQCMICDSFENGVIYIGTYSALIKVAADGTPTYITPKSEKGFFGLAAAQDPKNKFHLVAGGTDNIDYGMSGGLFETYDGGKTWRRINGMPAARDIWTLEFHPNLPRVYIGTSAGTFVYEYEKYTEDKTVVTDRRITALKRQNTENTYNVDYSFKLWNPQEQNCSVHVIIGLYTKYENKLIKSITREYKLAPMSSAEVDIPFESDGNTVLKAYLWSDKLTPLNGAYDWDIIANDPNDFATEN